MQRIDVTTMRQQTPFVIIYIEPVMDLWSRQHRVETRDSVLSNTSPGRSMYIVNSKVPTQFHIFILCSLCFLLFSEALQQCRNESLDTFLRHSLVSGVLAFIGVAVGIANVVVGLDDGRQHLAGGSLVPGIFVIFEFTTLVTMKFRLYYYCICTNITNTTTYN